MVHLVITFLYALPLIGMVFLLRQFDFGAAATYFCANTMALVVGVGAAFMERRTPFPTEPMEAPAYAYEVFHMWYISKLQLYTKQELTKWQP